MKFKPNEAFADFSSVKRFAENLVIPSEIIDDAVKILTNFSNTA